MDINQIVQSKINELNIEQIFKESLEVQIKETFERVLCNCFGSYSAFSKELEKQTSAQLTNGLEKFTIPEYTTFVLDKIHDLMKEQVSEERAEKIKASFAKKLAPHIESEIEQDDLIQAIIEGLEESVKDEWQTQFYTIKVMPRYHSYSNSSLNSTSMDLAIYDGDDDRDNKIACLTFHEDGTCYYHTGQRGDPITKRFASYVFNRTKILNSEACVKRIDSEYFI